MKDTKNEAPETTVQQNDEPVPEEAKPRKIMLGKRVLRHFNVKTGVQTGAGTSGCVGDTASARGHVAAA